MRTLFTIITGVLLNVAGCGKYDTQVPGNVVAVSGIVNRELITTGPLSENYWTTTTMLSQAISDSSFVVIQWDVYLDTGVFESTLRDTIKIGVSQCCIIRHSTSIVAANKTSRNAKVINAWSKSGQYSYTY
jgi:hypothetical protein